VLGIKSGFERIALDYLDLAPNQRVELQGTDGWRSRLERAGAWATLRDMSRRDPGLVLVAAGGAALFAGFMLLAFAGALAWLGDKGVAPRVRRLRIMIVLFPLYIVATAQVVDAAQSRHRAPAEFALCLLAVAGLPALRRVSSNLRAEVRRGR
jgi:hypothetical protein